MVKWFGSPAKKFAWIIAGCVALGLLIMLGMYASNESKIAQAIEDSQSYVDRIERSTSDIDSILSSVDYVYGSLVSDNDVEKITDHLRDIDVYMIIIDNDYAEYTRVADAVESYVESNTSYNSWNEYKEYLSKNYLIEDENDKSAEKLVKGVAYSSNTDMAQARKNSSVIVESLNHTTSGSNYKIYGTVTNNTSSIVRFVKVKVSMKDADNKVIDTETTYACGDEGLAPGESTKFECYIKKDSSADSYSAEIYDYD
ncbi:MAG: hypothetical protein GX567_02855 [Clostridia bacterium]|nr:hypothetical protein [Clostridia bacterium]